MSYWHAFCDKGRDPFGAPTFAHAWDRGSSLLDRAENRTHAAFEFCAKLGVDYYCFHDADIAPAGDSFADYMRNLKQMGRLLKHLQNEIGKHPLWGTANLFTHPRYARGAATNPARLTIRQIAHFLHRIREFIAVPERVGASSATLAAEFREQRAKLQALSDVIPC